MRYEQTDLKKKKISSLRSPVSHLVASAALWKAGCHISPCMAGDVCSKSRRYPQASGLLLLLPPLSTLLPLHFCTGGDLYHHQRRISAEISYSLLIKLKIEMSIMLFPKENMRN